MGCVKRVEHVDPGFTLIEVTVALAVIAGAMLIAVSALYQANVTARDLDVTERVDLALESALEAFRSGEAPLQDGIVVPVLVPGATEMPPPVAVRVEATSVAHLVRVVAQASYIVRGRQRERSATTVVWRE